MLEPEIGWLGCGMRARRNLLDEKLDASEFDDDAELAVIVHRAEPLRSEHVLIEACGLVRIEAAQMKMIALEVRHGILSLSALFG